MDLMFGQNMEPRIMSKLVRIIHLSHYHDITFSIIELSLCGQSRIGAIRSDTRSNQAVYTTIIITHCN